MVKGDCDRLYYSCISFQPYLWVISDDRVDTVVVFAAAFCVAGESMAVNKPVSGFELLPLPSCATVTCAGAVLKL